MQRLGQHFLKNKSAIHSIVNALALQPHDHIIEIGPGHGELTAPIIAACRDISCTITAIEKDSYLIPQLEKLFAHEETLLEVVEGDVLKCLDGVVEMLSKKNVQHYKIVGNIPYYITGNLLRVISELEPRPVCAVLMMQKEVGERLMAQPPRMNLLAAATQIWAEPKVVHRLTPQDFTPPPKVASLVIQLLPHARPLLEGVELEQYYRFIKILFRQPRKTILNNLTAGFSIERTFAETILTKQGISPLLRAQNLTLAQLITLSGCF